MKVSDWDKIETKWNIDEEKLKIIIDIEKELTTAFINYDLNNIYILLRAYRLHAYSKFKKPQQEEIEKEIDIISEKLNLFKLKNTVQLQKEVYLKSEALFLKISQLLKDSGVYFRENRSASTAILQRT